MRLEDLGEVPERGSDRTPRTDGGGTAGDEASGDAQETPLEVLFVGWILEAKGVRELLAAARAFSDVRFTLALRCPASACRGPLWERLAAEREAGLVEIADMPDYDSWAGAIAPEALEAVGLRPRKMPYKRGACELLFTKPVVLASGEVNACACRDVEAELIVGDVAREPLSAIWAGTAIDELIESHERGDYPDVCRRCTYFVSVYNSRRSRTFDSKGAPAGNWAED